MLGAQIRSDTSDDIPPSPVACLKGIFGSVPTLNYPASIDVFRQGQSAECVYLIGSGIVKLSCVDINGKEIIAGLRCRGWLLGATQIVLAQAHGLTATTLTCCQVATIPRAEFLKALGTQSRLSTYLHELHAKEVHDHLERLVELASRSSEFRLAKLLYDLAFVLQSLQSEDRENFKVPLKQWELAQFLTITPEHTSRVLRRMEQEGLVTHKGKSLLIADLEMLRSFLNRA
jgi:CRP-like cAMP-binding protein